MSIDKEKQEYDRAQKVGERVERMCREEGWSDHFIPMIQKRRDEAQSIVNDPDSDQLTTQLNRGVIKVCDEVLGYRVYSEARSGKIMRAVVAAKLS